MKEKKIQFINSTSGVEFYVWVQQFNRISKKIEDLHERLERLSRQDIMTGAHSEIEKSLKYYKDQKSIILSKIKDCMENTVTLVDTKEDKEDKPEEK